MEPQMSTGQWLLVTLTTGVGAVCSPSAPAAGVALMGQARGHVYLCRPPQVVARHTAWLYGRHRGASVAQQRPVLRDLRGKMGQLFGGSRRAMWPSSRRRRSSSSARRRARARSTSPQGGDSLRVLDANTLSWLNLTGSGNESAAHVLHNPRMTVMFCAFEGRRILRAMAGRGCCTGGRRLGGSAGTLSPSVAARQIFLLDIERVQASCGMSVPLFDYQGGQGGSRHGGRPARGRRIAAYWRKKNQVSLDGLESEILVRSGLPPAPEGQPASMQSPVRGRGLLGLQRRCLRRCACRSAASSRAPSPDRSRRWRRPWAAGTRAD